VVAASLAASLEPGTERRLDALKSLDLMIVARRFRPRE
jgi:hypothetical protein